MFAFEANSETEVFRWEQIGEKKLQLVSTNDIGWFAAHAFSHPNQYRNRALSLAGDELTQPEAALIFRDVIGKDSK